MLIDRFPFWLQYSRRKILAALGALGAGLLVAGSAAACPDWRQTGWQLSYSSDQLWAPQTLSVVAGGPNNLSTCPEPGHGYVATRPDFDLSFSGNGMGRDLEFRVSAGCDTVLLVNGADGQWYFDDDSGGSLNARIRIARAPEGTYDVWVGTYSPSTCQATLTLETFGGSVTPPPPPPPPPPVAACPNPSMNGQMLTYDAQGLWQPQRFSVVAGGNVDLASCAPVPGHGWIIQQPDFTLNLTSNVPGYDVEFRVEGSCDPVLLVNDWRGQWHYNDDADGLNSRLRVSSAQAGLYDVWVGTYNTQTCQATLVVETFPANVPPPPPPPTPLVSGVAYPVPMMGGERVDWCRVFGGECGQPGADAFCRAQGHGAATGWEYELVNRTWVLGSQQLCAATGSCGALRNVVCSVAAGPATGELPDPGNLTAYRSRVGETLAFRVTGAASGSLWGTGIYTDDSTLARAAVHAGVLQVGQTGTVWVTILPGQASYAPSNQYGVQSSGYGSWSGSYRFVSAGAGLPPAMPTGGRLLAVLPDAGQDLVAPGEAMGGNGVVDGMFRVGITAPGETITGFSVQSTGGAYSVWDTIPSNGYWLAAVVVGGQLMNRPDTSVSFALGAGETVIDYYVQQLEGRVGRDPMRMTVSFASGGSVVIDIPANFSGTVGAGSPPTMPGGGASK